MQAYGFAPMCTCVTSQQNPFTEVECWPERGQAVAMYVLKVMPGPS